MADIAKYRQDLDKFNTRHAKEAAKEKYNL